MKCPSCDGRLTSKRENYSYSASGLPYVTLVGVEVRRCAACGEHEVVIPRIEELHRVIALTVVKKVNRLTPEEIRFLRKYLGWSGVDFATHMGVKPETVSRWENGREPIGPVADRLLRTLVLLEQPVRDYSPEALAAIGDKPLPARLTMRESRNKWVGELRKAA